MKKYFRTNSDETKENKNCDPLVDNVHQADEEKALANYTTWLGERHAIHNKIGKKLCRQSGELLMNLGDESNQVKEEQKALEYTRIPQQFDKYRGNPEWWEFPPGLHDKCTHRRDEIIYFYKKTEIQRNQIPEIEKVGLPSLIKNEKMIFPRTRTNSDKTKENKNCDPLVDNVHQADEEKALANYTTWLGERHAIHNKIGKKLCRQSGELLMNLGDESNQVKEEQKALEYTRIPQQFDKYRGNPEWWEFPPGLHDKCTHRRDEIIYFYKKTEIQRNQIPEIEKVGLPSLIKNEKMIFPRTRSVYGQWQNSTYRKKKVKELSSLLKNIEPHKPDFDRLVVMGKNLENRQEETQTFDLIHRSSSLIKEAKRKTSIYDSSLKCCLKINGVYFYENSQSLASSRKFHVLFEYDVQSLPLETKYIVFENVGRVTIRLSWHKMEKFKLFRDISKMSNTEFFCFDKNLLILVPGQIFNFPIWFQTNKVCTVVETWEITTVPKFWPDAIRVFFVLQAQTHIENFMKRIRTIKTEISQKVKWRIIREILEDLTMKNKYENFKNIDYSYYEPELFEATNFDDSEPIRKPKYVYDKVIVEQLKKFYAEVRQSYHSKSWNLNVWDLQVLARVKDLIEYAEMRTNEFSQYRMMMNSKPEVEEKKSRSTLDFKITRSKMSSGTEIEDQSDLFSMKETKYAHLMKLLWKLAPPSITVNQERLKYFQVYSVFNAYFTLMSTELHTIRAFLVNEKCSAQNPVENCQRLIFEKFDDTQMIRTKRSFQEDINAQPKSEKISDLSVSDVRTMHKLYFSHSSSEFGFGKDRGKSEKNSRKKTNPEELRVSKSKPSRLPSNLSRTTLEEMGLVKVDFDPYDEVIPVVPTKHSNSISEDVKVDDGGYQELNKIESLSVHIIIYNYLSKAVDAMVDTLESAKEYKVPHENLEQLKACFKLFIEEEKEPEDKERPLNPFTNPEECDYFEKILKAHLNEVTGQYLICGKTEPIAGQHIPVTFWGGQNKEVCNVPEGSSIFSLYEREPDEISFEDGEAQTSQNMEFNDKETVSFASKDLICQCPSEFRHSPDSPSDMFYYSDDEIVEGQKIPGKDLISSEKSEIQDNSSDDGIRTEVPKRKPTMPRQSFSLLKEWNKKHCSRNELEGAEEMKQ